MPSKRKDYFWQYRERNRLAWNEATAFHQEARGDQTRNFKRGRNTLSGIERKELGDIRGLSTLHLQCNCGLDTLSMAMLGAHVVGVDISEEAIKAARRLSESSGIAAKFVCSDIYDYRPRARFDLIYSGSGSVYWLPKLSAW